MPRTENALPTKGKVQKPHGFWTFWRRRWDSNPRAREGYLISSLFVSVSRSGGFVLFSGRFVCAESRINKAFSPRKPCCGCIFSNRVQIGIFADFGEKSGKTGEKSQEKAIQNSIHRRKGFKPTKSIFEVYQMKNLPIDWDSVPDVVNPSFLGL